MTAKAVVDNRYMPQTVRIDDWLISLCFRDIPGKAKETPSPVDVEDPDEVINLCFESSIDGTDPQKSARFKAVLGPRNRGNPGPQRRNPRKKTRMRIPNERV
jgi:hypothetical protein